MDVNAIRDALVEAAPEHAKTIMTRDEVATRICDERGWDKNDLSIEQVLEIRDDPDWKAS